MHEQTSMKDDFHTCGSVHLLHMILKILYWDFISTVAVRAREDMEIPLQIYFITIHIKIAL